MENKKYLSDQEVRQVEIAILDYIDKVCRENGIKYCLDYGTLLGAIRHKGFIPWDDDIDVCMTREDYNKFINVMQTGADPQFKFLTSDNDKEFPYEVGKVVDTRTALIETDLQTSPAMGVWVDVFPKDHLPKHHKFLRMMIFLSYSFRVFATCTKFPTQHSKVFYPVWLIARLFGYRFFLRVTKFWTGICNKSADSQYYANLRDFVSKEFRWDRSFYEDIVMVDFEGKKYPAPRNWDAYLTGLYGDYMQLPPEDKRKRHKFVTYWR